jgi:serine/threonine-protein kinase
VLFWLLTGTLPYDDPDDIEATVRFHIDGQMPSPSSRRAGLSPLVDDTVLKLLSRDPAQRPTSEQAELLVARLVSEAASA